MAGPAIEDYGVVAKNDDNPAVIMNANKIHRRQGFKSKDFDNILNNIQHARQLGLKVTGYFCPLVTEELILASGMFPLRLPLIPTGSSIGEKPGKCWQACSVQHKTNLAEGLDLNVLDSLIITCPENDSYTATHCFKECFDQSIFTLELPRVNRYRSDYKATAKFRHNLKMLAKNLGQFNRQPINIINLSKAITQSDKIKELLRGLYEYPIRGRSPVEWQDVFKLQQAGYSLERPVFKRNLLEHQDKLAQINLMGLPVDAKPRLMLAGFISNELLELVKGSNAVIVTDYSCSGSMLLRKRVPVFGFPAPFDYLVERYLYNAPCLYMEDYTAQKYRMITTARRYNVHGLVFYGPQEYKPLMKSYEALGDALYHELAIPPVFIDSSLVYTNTSDIQERLNNFIDIIGGRIG
ncbi:MAG: 2-hydroxyacyl-CoA dehydratase [Dehalococcoidales bacterium]|nr:2-hydroxyacyl-CoA dehydratase [Dehalococcoidales bacterium]